MAVCQSYKERKRGVCLSAEKRPHAGELSHKRKRRGFNRVQSEAIHSTRGEGMARRVAVARLHEASKNGSNYTRDFQSPREHRLRVDHAIGETGEGTSPL